MIAEQASFCPILTARPRSGAAWLAAMKAVLARGQTVRFTARGWSMGPWIRDGDRLWVAPCAAGMLGVGAVVAARLPPAGRLVVHRVVARRAAAWRLRGDGLDHDDGWVDADAILGHVVRVERARRRVRLGLGPERRLIAWLSRHGWLSAMTRAAVRAPSIATVARDPRETA